MGRRGYIASKYVHLGAHGVSYIVAWRVVGVPHKFHRPRHNFGSALSLSLIM